MEAAPAAAKPPKTGVIAEGPDEIDDALDELQGAFDTVQAVITQFEGAANHDDPAAAQELETEAQRQQRDNDLADQLQALLDEASVAEPDAIRSPHQVVAQTKADLAHDPPPPPPPPPSIDQLDTLLADHAEDSLAGTFEDGDAILGVATPPPSASTARPASAPEALATEGDVDDLFDALDRMEAQAAKIRESTLAQPSEARDAAAEDFDEIEGLFEAPKNLGLSTPLPGDSSTKSEPVIQGSAADSAGADEADAEQDFEGGFESLDDMLDAEIPAEADGAPAPAPPAPTPAPVATKTAVPVGPTVKTPVAVETVAKPKKVKADAEPWQITLNLAMFRAAAVLLLGVVLWTCALVNKPMDKLPDDMKQAVSWVALAVAGPGVLLVFYGLLFN